MKIPEHIKNIKTLVGYLESTNKKSCETGADMAFIIAERYYSDLIKSLEDKIQSLNQQVDFYKNDLTTLSNIIMTHTSKGIEN